MREVKEYKVCLKTESPFRIGGQKDPFSKVDQPIAKIGGKIVVQGTSLKGAFRHELEEYLIGNYPNRESMKPCIPSDNKTISKDERKLITNGKYKGASCVYPYKEGKHDGSQKRICPVCYLLGAQGLIGFVTVPFLNADVTPSDLYSIRVDRAKGTAADRTNRGYPIIPEGIEFEGMLTVLIKDGVRGWELGKDRVLQESIEGDKWLKGEENWDAKRILKELIKERLEAVKVMGGLKSSGAGKVKITVEEVK